MHIRKLCAVVVAGSSSRKIQPILSGPSLAILIAPVVYVILMLKGSRRTWRWVQQQNLRAQSGASGNDVWSRGSGTTLSTVAINFVQYAVLNIPTFPTS